MKSLFVLLGFFLLFSLSAVITRAAGEVIISLDPTTATLVSGESKQITATITNNQNVADSFTVSVFPSVWQGTTTNYPNRVTVNAHSNEQITITFSASQCVEEFNNIFSIKVQSISNSQLSASSGETITTQRKFQVCIVDVKLDKTSIFPGETVTATIIIENPAASNSLPLKLTATIKSASGDIRQTFEDDVGTISGRSTVEEIHSYTFGNYSQAGLYTFSGELIDNFNKSVSFESNTIQLRSTSEKVIQTKDITYGLLLQTVTIKVKNGGNEPVNNVFVYETIPSFMKLFFFPKDAPLSESASDDKIVYAWLIPSVLPGEEKTITYQIAVWNAALIIIGVILLILIVFRYVFTIRIVKSYKKFATVAGAKEIQIQLEVRNRTRHVHKDVIVRDVVPATAHIIEKFDTLRPTMRKLLGGTELIWKFDTLRPHEERVITYRIKPAMEIIGQILLPKAIVRYMDRNKQVRRSVSKNIEIKV